MIQQELEQNTFTYMTVTRVNQPITSSYNVYVVFHVIDRAVNDRIITDAQLDNAITYLNNAFNKQGAFVNSHLKSVATGITFCKAKVNRIANATATKHIITNDLQLKNLSRENPTKYLNVWVVDEILEKSSDTKSFANGYAYYAGAHGTDFDGIVMREEGLGVISSTVQQELRAITFVHEVGHYLNLAHAFNAVDMESNQMEATCLYTDPYKNGDRCADTPPILTTDPSNPNAGRYINCLQYPNGVNTCTADAENDLIENFMDYSSCRILFTKDQKDRMLFALTTTRASLLTNSPLFSINNANIGSTVQLCKGSTYTIKASSSLVNTDWTWTVTGTDVTITTEGANKSEVTVNLSPSASGNYTLTGNVNLQGCTNSTFQADIIIQAVDQPTISNISGNTDMCNGYTQTFTANETTGQTGITYKWTAPNSTSLTQTANQATVVYPTTVPEGSLLTAVANIGNCASSPVSVSIANPVAITTTFTNLTSPGSTTFGKGDVLVVRTQYIVGVPRAGCSIDYTCTLPANITRQSGDALTGTVSLETAGTFVRSCTLKITNSAPVNVNYTIGYTNTYQAGCSCNTPPTQFSSTFSLIPLFKPEIGVDI